jgi:transglutaminase-like putative cysteine protease
MAHRFTRRLVLCLALACLATAAPASAPPHEDGAGDSDAGAVWDTELWSVARINGDKAGWGLTARKRLRGGGVVSRETTVMRLSRAGAELAVEESTTVREDAHHRVLSIDRRVRQGDTLRREHYAFDHAEGTIKTEVRSSDLARPDAQPSVRRRTIEMPDGPWLSPAAQDAYTKRRLNAGAESFAFRSLIADNGSVRAARSVFALRGTERFELPDGAEVVATRLAVETDEMPGAEIETLVDGEGNELWTTLTLGAFSVETRLASRDAAQAEWSAPEFMASVSVAPRGEPLTRPRSLARAVYTLRVREGALPDLPSTAAQSVEMLDDRTARVVVDLVAPAPPAEVTPDERARALASTAAADGSDERVVRFASKAIAHAGLGEEADAEAIAEALRRAVYEHIADKSLGRAFASASETVRSRAGDCTEHAALLVAALRSSRIPARAVAGVIYVRGLSPDANSGVAFDAPAGAFGYHMWVQALVPHPSADGAERWIDLDAAWLAPFDAAHIALDTTMLGDDERYGDLATLLSLIGNTGITVEEAGRERETSPSQE